MQSDFGKGNSNQQISLARSRSRYRDHRPNLGAPSANTLAPQYITQGGHTTDSKLSHLESEVRRPSRSHALKGKDILDSGKKDRRVLTPSQPQPTQNPCTPSISHPSRSGKDKQIPQEHDKHARLASKDVPPRNESQDENDQDCLDHMDARTTNGKATSNRLRSRRTLRRRAPQSQEQSDFRQKVRSNEKGRLPYEVGSAGIESKTNRNAAAQHPADVCQPASSFDAPVSAVNAGERRVTVECQGSVIVLPVSTSTTPVHLIRSVGKQLGVALDPNVHTVSESFRQLGLERPLRSYERVRDILNSWDNDGQNALVISPNATGEMLPPASTPGDKQPECGPAVLYHSQIVGRWDKKPVLLRRNGQIATMKKNIATNLCHLSDFEIFLPTRRQLAKRIKPPKKHCFAIKSQQKASMFLTSESFLHIFCTNDKALADQWYTAVQSWRSWYLVNVLGEGKEDHAQSPDPLSSQTRPKNNTISGSHNLNTTGQPPDSSRPAGSYSSHTTSPRADQIPFKPPETQNLGSSPYAKPEIADQPFSAKGLLGRTYTQRKQAQEGRDRLPRPGATAALARSSGPTSVDKAATSSRELKNGAIDSKIEPSHHAEQKGTKSGPLPFVHIRQGDIEPEFSSNSLLSKANGQGNNQSLTRSRTQKGGRGERSSAPMVDLTMRSRFVPGSLLASVEQSQGGYGKPVIDRSRKAEVKVATGEYA